MINFDWENSWMTSSCTLSEQRCERKILVIKYALLWLSRQVSARKLKPHPPRPRSLHERLLEDIKAERKLRPVSPDMIRRNRLGEMTTDTNPRSEIILLTAWHISTNSHCSDSHTNVLIFRRNLSGGALLLTFCMTAFSEPNPSTQDIKHYPWINLSNCSHHEYSNSLLPASISSLY